LSAAIAKAVDSLAIFELRGECVELRSDVECGAVTGRERLM